jgi:hypothetical protein
VRRTTPAHPRPWRIPWVSEAALGLLGMRRLPYWQESIGLSAEEPNYTHPGNSPRVADSLID